jgi:hypothetical protein
MMMMLLPESRYVCTADGWLGGVKQSEMITILLQYK